MAGVKWQKGEAVLALDKLENWVPAKIISVSKDAEGMTLIHFYGWSKFVALCPGIHLDLFSEESMVSVDRTPTPALTRLAVCRHCALPGSTTSRFENSTRPVFANYLPPSCGR